MISYIFQVALDKEQLESATLTIGNATFFIFNAKCDNEVPFTVTKKNYLSTFPQKPEQS
jgi:hypothetical protein